MRTVVVDASVAAKWFVPEPGSRAATRLLVSRKLLAPDFLGVELANVVWKRCRRGEIDPGEAVLLATDIGRFPIELVPSTPHLAASLEIALALRLPVYDALYLTVAVHAGCEMVTADARFARAARRSPWAARVLQLGE